MTTLEIPSLSLLDEAAALEDHLERAASLFGPSPFLASSLPGLLMWSDRYTYVLARRGPASFVLSAARGETYVPRPPAPFNPETIGLVFEYLEKANDKGPGFSRIEGLTEEEARQAEKAGWAARPLTEEYFYDRGRTAALSGDSYRDRRNEINRLSRDHALLGRAFRPSDLELCGELYEKWKRSRKSHLDAVGVRMMEHSQKAHLRMLGHLDAWGLNGHLVFVDGRLGAYTVAGPMGADTLGVYLEVADLEKPGCGTYSFVQLCRTQNERAWIDAGDAEFLPGLAQAKDSWHPARKVMRWAIEPKPDR